MLHRALFTLPIADRMGIPRLRWNVPVMTLRRLSADSETIRSLLIAPDGSRLTTKSKIHGYFRRDLISRCDDSGLRQSNVVPVTNSWLSDGSSLMSGRDFIAAIRVRFNCLFNKSRAVRRRDVDKLVMLINFGPAGVT